MIKEHERIILTVAVPDHGLQPGDIGTVVHVYQDSAAYEVEFSTLAGQTTAVVTLESQKVRPIGARDIGHAREI
jgi:hypothetical protein